jgi:hypothetical protein
LTEIISNASTDLMLSGMRKVWQMEWQENRLHGLFAAGPELYRLYKDELVRRGAYPMGVVFKKLWDDGIDHLAFQGLPVVLDESLEPMQFRSGALA